MRAKNFQWDDSAVNILGKGLSMVLLSLRDGLAKMQKIRAGLKALLSI